jgi:hypothetical protein
MKIIFLDIDGVLNCEEAYKSGLHCRYVHWFKPDYETEHDYHQSFYPKSKKLLNKLIDKTGAKIVISSTWRHSGLEWMREVWSQEEMSGEIIGITPHLNLIRGYTVPRGCEIEYWLDEHDFRHINWSKERQQEYIDKSGIENYIIIDDDSDMLYGQRNHFVHVLPSPRNKSGFNETYYEEALEKLSKNIIEINFTES